SDAGAISLGGQVIPGQLRPTHGSIVSGVLGVDPEQPRFMSLGGRLHQGKKAIAGETAGLLGAWHDAFRLDYHPETGVNVPALELMDGVTTSGLDHRHKLLRAFDGLEERVAGSASRARLDR